MIILDKKFLRLKINGKIEGIRVEVETKKLFWHYSGYYKDKLYPTKIDIKHSLPTKNFISKIVP